MHYPLMVRLQSRLSTQTFPVRCPSPARGQQKSVDAAVKKVVQEAGRIDLLINNAGKKRRS